MKISKIQFVEGKATKEPPLEISPGEVTIIVGPNNSGKSLTLSEIQQHLAGGAPRKIIDAIEIEYPPTQKELKDMIQLLGPIQVPNAPDKFQIPDPTMIGGNNMDINVIELSHVHNYHAGLLQGGKSDSSLRKEYVKYFCVRLDATIRLSLLNGKELGDQHIPARNHLDTLMRNNELRTKVQDIVLRAFPNHYFTIDQNGLTYQIRLSGEKISQDDEQIRNAEMAAKMREVTPINDFGDGIKAFVGIVTGIVALGRKFILIDDPEAFLHPPVARVLGQSLVYLAESRKAQIFISTHSPDIVLGCLESAKEARIVRLTYDDLTDVATTSQIEPSLLKELMKDRLLRSTGVFSGLFHRGVVVTESEEDKVFYDEINRRLRLVGRGHIDTLFLNAQNWQTTGEIIGPLRGIGIPAVAILDVDVLKNNTSSWKALIEGCSLPDDIGNDIGSLVTQIKKEVPSTNDDDSEQVKQEKNRKKNEFKVKGLSFLSSKTREEAQRFTDKLEKYGIFVVRLGQLESWLSSLNISSKKSKWVREVFKTLEKQNVTPTNDDVWEFLDKIAQWLSNPNHGMP